MPCDLPACCTMHSVFSIQKRHNFAIPLSRYAMPANVTSAEPMMSAATQCDFYFRDNQSQWYLPATSQRDFSRADDVWCHPMWSTYVITRANVLCCQPMWFLLVWCQPKITYLHAVSQRDFYLRDHVSRWCLVTCLFAIFQILKHLHSTCAPCILLPTCISMNFYLICMFNWWEYVSCSCLLCWSWFAASFLLAEDFSSLHWSCSHAVVHLELFGGCCVCFVWMGFALCYILLQEACTKCLDMLWIVR